ncbi:HNH endonuclease [Massilia arenae]|uniref:HNH endonuclease n=1 Tax=Massilia arenae TaxID=2603288 RepID=A0A5C7G206_9BURK|nr:HNH endonuclease [Massilia arenae]TXF99984.1 hypothetical protein FVD38_09870 [Massilia arenae]
MSDQKKNNTATKKQLGVRHIKLLWGRAAQRCAICQSELTADGETAGADSYVLGEQAHIAGENPGSARYDVTLSPTYVNSYANLILLCRNHHGEVDKNEDAWPPSRLHKLKADHESWVRTQFQNLNNVFRHRDLRTLEDLMSNVYTADLCRIYNDLPRKILQRDLYFNELFNNAINAPSFHLFNTTVNDIVLRAQEAWNRCYDHLEQYRASDERRFFSNPGDAPLSPEQQGPWGEIEQASSDFIYAMDDLIGEIKTRFQEIDLVETDRRAANRWLR